ncbi:MAG: cyclic nucleotide-binding domain-containing protein [Acidobacteriota bacterium]|nr:cyclic nucleotide-binding domain-containing protein [Acidobacteriota bacterium]
MALFSWKKKTPQELMIAGNFKAAVKAFQDVLNKKGFDPGMAMQLANCQMKLGLTKDAKKVFLRVGTFYGDQGFFNKAVAAFKKALNITPDDQGILDKLAEYHGKVPSYMIDDRILQRASGFFQAPDLKAMDLDDTAGGPEADEAEISEQPAEPPEAEVAAEVETPTGISTEQPGEPAEDPLGDFDSFHGLEDLSEELTAEFDLDDAPPADGALPQDEMNFGKIEDFDEDTGDFEEEAKAAAAMNEKGTDVLKTLDVNEPEEKTTPAPPPESPAKPAAAVRERVAGGMVFSSREVADEPEAKDPADSMFNSFDDALDNLFSTGGDEPAPATESDHEQNQRHWPLFRTMERKDFLDFVMALESRDFDPGGFIVQQGDEGQEMFLIADGIVDVEINDAVVATLGEGDFFGEASLLTRSPRNASCRAKSFTNCLVLTRDHLVDLSKTNPSIMDSIRSIYYTRVEQNAARRK